MVNFSSQSRYEARDAGIHKWDDTQKLMICEDKVSGRCAASERDRLVPAADVNRGVQRQMI
jgi:hypothetical protein